MPSPRRLSCATILVVDDDVTFGTALRRLLEGDGHSVHQVLDGDEAVRRVNALGSDLDLVLLDLLLPKLSGFDVVKRLAEAGCTVPVLVMTGIYDDAREIRALRTMGTCGWIHKSAPFEHFLFRVNGLLCPQRQDTRASHRVATSVPVQWQVTGEDEACYGTSYNLSATGIYVRSAEPPVDGTVVLMSLALPTAEEMIEVEAEVVHAAGVEDVKGTAYPAGFGARFTRMTPLAAAAIRRLVDQIHAQETGTETQPSGVEIDELIPAQVCS